MATNPTIPFKEQIEQTEKLETVYRNVSKELQKVVDLSYEELDNEINLIKKQQSILEKLRVQGKISEGLFKVQNNILEATKNVYEQQFALGKITPKYVNALWDANEALQKHIGEQKKVLTLEDALRKAGLGRLVDIAEFIKTYGKQNALLLTSLAGLVLLVRSLWKDFRAIDSAAAEFRKTIGIVRKDSERLEKIARNITFNYAHLGVTAQDVYKSMLAITSVMGSSQGITEDMVRDMTILSVQLGVAETTSADFLRVMGQLGKTTMDVQKNMALFTAALSAQAGTNLNEVMSDVAAASKSGYQFLSRDPLALAKAAVEARKMGTSLESTTHTASSLLNFTESVKNEIQCSCWKVHQPSKSS